MYMQTRNFLSEQFKKYFSKNLTQNPTILRKSYRHINES